MSCCTNIISLGCFDSCQDISTGITATQTGTYVITVNDSAILEFSQISGQEIIIPGGYFNEDAKTTFQIIKPDGIALTDCYTVEILINYSQEAEASIATVNINGVLISTVACGTTKNILVKYENGTAVGTIIDSSNVQIPNPGVCDCDYDVYINGVFSQAVNLVNCEDLTINIV